VTNVRPAAGPDGTVEKVWCPTPFRQFVIKVASRCNLSCDYCYMYHMADQSWLVRPKVMSPDVIEKTGCRIAEHALAHDLRAVEVVLHGGEPLLVGVDTLAEVIATLGRTIPEDVALTLTVQTNGVLLDEPVLDLFRRHRVRVSVSLDGDESTHDRHRRYANGRGSFAKVARGLRLLNSEPYRELFAGLLCVIDVDADPVDTYESLLSFSPPKVNFLLPHGNWSSFPPSRTAGSALTPYGDWLVAVFDRWFDAPGYDTEVRLFGEIINLLLGGSSNSESVGLSPVGMIDVDTDGTMEQVDTLRSTYHGAADTGLNVLRDSFDTALGHPTVIERQIGLDALAPGCRKCPIMRICGGGHYAHRYREGNGFRNPSVYCPDLARLIKHIHQRLRAEAGLAGEPEAAGSGLGKLDVAVGMPVR
jgi:uncharacterized protein